MQESEQILTGKRFLEEDGMRVFDDDFEPVKLCNFCDKRVDKDDLVYETGEDKHDIVGFLHRGECMEARAVQLRSGDLTGTSTGRPRSDGTRPLEMRAQILMDTEIYDAAVRYAREVLGQSFSNWARRLIVIELVKNGQLDDGDQRQETDSAS